MMMSLLCSGKEAVSGCAVDLVSPSDRVMMLLLGWSKASSSVSLPASTSS